MTHRFRTGSILKNIVKITVSMSVLILGIFAFSSNIRADTLKASPSGPSLVYQSNPGTSKFSNGHGYGALSPRVVQLKHQANPADNGKLLLTFEQVITDADVAAGKLPVFPIYESDDNGVTWKHITDIKETHQAGYGKMNCPQLYELPQTIGDMPKGTVVLAGNSTPNDLNGTQLELEKSTDAGQN